MLLCGAAFLGVWLLSAPAAYGADAMVPDDYPSIEDAVQLVTDSNGDGLIEIMVRPGHYHENLVITRSNLVLSGMEAGAVVLMGSGSEPTVFIDGASGVQLRNLMITGESVGDGVALADSDHCRIELNTIGGNQKGISLVRSSENVITANNVVHNVRSGIKLNGGHDNSIRDNLVQGNLFGVVLLGGSNHRVDLNTVKCNASVGIAAANGEGSRFWENMVFETGRQGMFLKNMTDVDISYNFFMENGVNGLRLTGSIGLVVSRNRFYANCSYGIRSRDSEADFDGSAPGIQTLPGDNMFIGNQLGEWLLN